MPQLLVARASMVVFSSSVPHVLLLHAFSPCRGLLSKCINTKRNCILLIRLILYYFLCVLILLFESLQSDHTYLVILFEQFQVTEKCFHVIFFRVEWIILPQRIPFCIHCVIHLQIIFSSYLTLKSYSNRTIINILLSYPYNSNVCPKFTNKLFIFLNQLTFSTISHSVFAFDRNGFIFSKNKSFPACLTNALSWLSTCKVKSATD